MKALRVTGNVFILIGATFLFFVVYEFVGTAAVTRGHQRVLAAEFDEEPIVEPTPTETPEPEQPPPPPKQPRIGDPVARIRIPKINVNYIVVEGTSLRQLAQGPGHYRGSALPGQPGSVGVAGHRTGWGSPFIDLDRLGPGDRITLETKDGTRYVYEVTRTRVVQPGDVWVLDGDPRSDSPFTLTLTTCTPKYTSRDRLIVWADQIRPAIPDDEPAPEVPSDRADAA